jgi:hypothetical protein
MLDARVESTFTLRGLDGAETWIRMNQHVDEKIKLTSFIRHDHHNGLRSRPLRVVHLDREQILGEHG